MQLPIETGDRVIASFPWRDKVIVITEQGRIYMLECSEGMTLDSLTIRLVSN